jgi:hypothetical protein
VQPHIVERKFSAEPRRTRIGIADAADGIPDADAADTNRIMASCAEACQGIDIALVIRLSVEIPGFIDGKIGVAPRDTKLARLRAS